MIKSLAEQVYDHVVRMIQTGELKEGDKVGEVFLVERIGISRTPIREALIQLASDNILENVPRKGFYVKGINNDALNKVYELVCLLDLYAVELAMDNIGDKEIAEMEECIEKMDLAVGLKVYDIYERWQKRFHEIYREATGNDEINDTIEYLLKKIISSTYILGEEEQLFEVSQQYNQEHREILKAIVEKDVNKTKELIKNHWTGGQYNR